MGNRVLYRRRLNVGFLIIDKKTLIPFGNSNKRDNLEEVINDILPQYKDGDLIGFLYNSNFGSYLEGAWFHYFGEDLKKFNERIREYKVPESKLYDYIMENDLDKFKIEGKLAQHSDTLDFIIGVLLDIDKSIKVKRICFDYMESKKDDHEFMKMLGGNQWDDIEYQFRYKNPDAGFISRLFDTNNAYQNGLSLRRSEVQSIVANGDGTIIIFTKTNSFKFNYIIS